MTGKVLYINKNDLGVHGTIIDSENNKHYFNTKGIVKGNFLQKDSNVTFDVEQQSNGKTRAFKIKLFVYKCLDDTQKQIIANLFSSKINGNNHLNCADIPYLLKSIGVDYKEYSEDLGSFIRNNFAGTYVVKKNVDIEGKIYPAILVSVDILSLEKKNKIIEKLSDEIRRKKYIQCSMLPILLSEIDVDYHLYSDSITQFIITYLANDFCIKKNVPIDGKTLPHILVLANTDCIEQSQITSEETDTETNSSIIEVLQKYISEGQYYNFLTSEEFLNHSPDQLGVNGIELAVQAVAGYLGDQNQISLNKFQRILIETEHAAELSQFKDDEDFLQQGLCSTFRSVSFETFNKNFANVYHGKNNLNNNWNALAERFWCVENELSFYFNVLWLISSKKERCLRFYIDTGIQHNEISRTADLLKIWKDFSGVNGYELTPSIKRKILGNFLALGNSELLCSVIELFDDITMPEIKQLPLYLRSEEEINSEILFGYFHSEVKEEAAEAIVNYFWYHQSAGQSLPENIIRTLSSVCWDYEKKYFESILYNQAYVNFDIKQKTKILLQAFPYLCEYTKAYKKAFLLVNYIYVYMIKDPSEMTDIPYEQYTEKWNTLKNWMLDQIKIQFSDDIRTIDYIRIFKYDDSARHELETMYCEQFIRPLLDQCLDNDEQEDLLEQYEKKNVQFITQWIANNYRKTFTEEVEWLIQEQKFSEAIRWVQKQKIYDPPKNKKILRNIICENFKIRGFKDNAYEIYHNIPIELTEEIILEGFTANDDDAIKALFATYIYQKNWLKVAYLYAPYSATRQNIHVKLYDDIKNILEEHRIEAHKYAVNHLAVLKTALRVLSNEDFDLFVEWAKKIQIPYNSPRYKLTPQTFDPIFKKMLFGEDYSACWDQLVDWVLQTDNAEYQDMFRYSIITSYIGRYGAENFQNIIFRKLAWRESRKDYYGYYTNIWKGLFDGKYNCNIISQNIPLIDKAPVTYWNLFYDIAVSKNRIFSLRDLWGTQWHDGKYDLQTFYSSLLKQYSESRETIFLQIAVKLLEQYDGVIVNTEFERYFPYCNSNKSKDFLFHAIIHLLTQKKYLSEIGIFLNSGYWYHTEKESKLSFVLEQICNSDYKKFNENLRLDLNEYWYERFVSDFLSTFTAYPEVDIVKILRGSDADEQYCYSLIKHTMQISYTPSQWKGLQSAGLMDCPRFDNGKTNIVLSYLEMMDVCYRKQLQTEPIANLVRVQNRYHRILAADILRREAAEALENEDIVALMQNNKHFSDVYNNYKQFKEILSSLLKSETMSDYQRNVVLLSVVSNEWGEFIDHIAEYHPKDLACINSMMELSNYRELNMQLLTKYILTLHGAYSDADVMQISEYSPKVGCVLEELRRTQQHNSQEYEKIVKVIISICRLKQQDQPELSYEKLDYALFVNKELIYEKWDLFANALWSTSYESTIIFLFGKDIRNMRKRCDFQKIERWKPIFHSISKTSVYYYLLAVWYAIDHKRKEAVASYGKVVAKSDIPFQWNQERKELEEYLDGRSNRFIVTNNKNVSVLSAELEARNLDFLTSSVVTDDVSSEEAAAAYKIILENTSRTGRLDAYKKLFKFVRNPDNLFEVFRQVDMKKEKLSRKTYNELVIEFGSLLITEDSVIFTHDQKYAILSDIMEVYELLSDLNKEKISVMEQLKAAENFVLGTSGLSMAVWLKNFEKIKAIMSHPVIGNPAGMLRNLFGIVEQCVRKVEKFESQMQILEWLSEWRNNWNVSSNCSDYERAFAKSVDDELYRLRHGVNLKLVILNDNNIIEDESIFYQVENIAGKSNQSIMLDNRSGIHSAQLEVRIGINGETPEVYDNPGFNSTIELRPGDLCGQVYRLHSSILSRINVGDRVEVIFSIVVDGAVICNNADTNRVFVYECSNGILTPDKTTINNNYETAVPAFSNKITGFGREHEQEMIRGFMEQQLVIIYGPSRVGKSSLMNYINNDYTKAYCAEHTDTAVISIMIAGEGNTEDDYNVNVLNQESLKDYDAKKMMNYLFLDTLRLAFCIEEQDSRCEYYGRTFPQEVRDKIKEILRDSGAIGNKYKAISRILTANKCEIWLLFDEFQQLITRLAGMEAELAKLCNHIKYNLTGIKLALCGSDDLLRLLECDNDPKWNTFKINTSVNSVPIGQLEPKDFAEMMEDQRIWARLQDRKPFSESALKLLHHYTGGNAICGKIFGNEILNRIREGVYSKRRKIYPSDVTQIVFSLLSSEVGLVQTLLVAHNTKNLENEQKYLWFIARELALETNRSDVSYRNIREFFQSRSAAEIDLALKILVARGILKTGADKNRYGFTTMFYFDFFKSQVTEARIQELYDAEHIIQEPDHALWMDQITDILKNQPKVTSGNMIHIIDSLKNPDVEAGIGKQYGGATTIHNGDIVEGNKIGEQKILINAQTINTAFNILLTDPSDSESVLKASENMPTLGAYLEEPEKQQLLELNRKLQGYQEDYTDSDTPEDQLAAANKIRETEISIEALTVSSEQQMLSDTMGAAIASDCFTDMSEVRWIELLNLGSQEELKQIQQLPSDIVIPLSFAVMLHNIFDKISIKMRESGENSGIRELDFCPVAIMYCKVVEVILKKLHTPIYIEKIGDATVKYGGVKFKDLLGPDGITILPTKDLTIGSFSYQIVYLDKNNDVDEPERFKASPKKSVINCITGVDDRLAAINEEWYRHAKALAVIQAIRNKSAHEAAPIRKTNFEWLVQTLFKEGELLRIAALAGE